LNVTRKKKFSVHKAKLHDTIRKKKEAEKKLDVQDSCSVDPLTKRHGALKLLCSSTKGGDNDGAETRTLAACRRPEKHHRRRILLGKSPRMRCGGFCTSCVERKRLYKREGKKSRSEISPPTSAQRRRKAPETGETTQQYERGVLPYLGHKRYPSISREGEDLFRSTISFLSEGNWGKEGDFSGVGGLPSLFVWKSSPGPT